MIEKIKEIFKSSIVEEVLCEDSFGSRSVIRVNKTFIIDNSDNNKSFFHDKLSRLNVYQDLKICLFKAIEHLAVLEYEATVELDNYKKKGGEK